jgi:hypothetical protein
MDLGKVYGNPDKELKSLIDYRNFGFTEADLDKKFYIDLPALGGILSKDKSWTLRTLIDAL